MIEFNNLQEMNEFLNSNEVFWNQDWVQKQINEHSENGHIWFFLKSNIVETPNYRFEVYFKWKQ